MYYYLSQILFWCYWAIAAVTAALLVHEIWRGGAWKTQATAALAVLPFILRVLLLK